MHMCIGSCSSEKTSKLSNDFSSYSTSNICDLILENPTYRAKMKNQVIESLGNGNRNGTFDTVLAAMVAEL